MKKWIVLLLPLLLIWAPKIRAQGVQDFVITDFTADYYLSREDPQGSMRVVEDISVNFSGSNHGIERAIPAKYKGQGLGLSVNSVSSRLRTPSQYTTRSENNNIVLRIGDPNRTVTGEQQYTIDYTVHNFIGFYDGHDELYWDVNGDQWSQPFGGVEARVHLPDGLEADGQLDCYSGAYGSSADYCAISQEGSTVTAVTTNSLSANETLTIVVGFKKGFFRPATFGEKLRDNLGTILKLSLPPLLIGGYAWRRWRKYGRDPAGRGTIVPEYDAPDGLGPAEVGTITDFRTDQREITATIIDLAVRGYIKIIEEKKVKRLAKDTLEYSLEQTKADYSELKDHEKEILSGLFGPPQIGAVIELKSLKNKFYTSAQKAQKETMTGLVSGNYFRGNPASAGTRLWVLLGLLFMVAVFGGALLGVALTVGVGLAAIPLFIFALAMPARTEKGVAAKEHALGLKLYLETAEKDRLAMMQSPDAPYTRTAEPKKTVHLYEKLLPYAIVFGVEKQWSEQFKDVYTSAPGWYSGSNVHAFNSVYLASALSGSMNSAFTTAYASPSSSSSSGFGGGGGFSGGGGGGGGGGGW